MRFRTALPYILLSILLLISLNTVSFAEEAAVAPEDCSYEEPDVEKYEAEFVSVRRPLRVDTNDEFKVKAFIKNTGNVPWFSSKSSCEDAKMLIGTENKRDHASELYSPDIDEEDNNWESAYRVNMDQLRVNPGEIASFSFWVGSGEGDDVIKEFFSPVLEGLKWLDDAKFSFEVIIGEPDEDKSTLAKKLIYSGESGSVLDLDLDAEKKLSVDLSDQKLFVMLGDSLVREFKISSGAARTPTPTGNFSIHLKNEVRVGGKAPHYIMPRFMMFKGEGYGFHALPSLRTDGGKFWNEARSHIGIPVSHGCVRLLPEDADFLYAFTEVGTKVIINK